ncbi:MAG: sodium:solute symporter family protein, partial [Acidobacteria bacterium]|nr:sodium:solute symporter family protein [Acidobacteriota bacterium]
DWVVLIGYLVGIAALGIWIGRKVGDTEHYFLGARRFNKWIMIGQSLGAGTHADMPVSLAGAVYGIGVSGIWYQWKNMFATPFYWLLAPLYRRMRRTTIAEVFEDRYGAWMGAVYMLFAMGFLTINVASMLKGAAKVISQAVGGNVPVNEIVVAMTAIFMLYSFIGGMVSSAWTDFFQGFLILTLSFLLVPLGWNLVGGMDGMKAALAADRFSLATPGGIGGWFILMLTINGLIGITSMPHLMGMVATGKDENTCRIGFLYGTFVKRFCTLGWAMVGIMVAAMLAQGRFGVTSLKEPEEAFGFACRHLLFPGGVGLLIASVLATNMAGCSAYMVDAGALFAKSFYGRYFVRGRPDRHYLWVGRVGGLSITLAAVVYALFFIDRVLNSFLLTETMATYMGISVLGGIFWRRANRWGALAATVAAMTTNFAVYAAMGQRFDHWDPNVFLIALSAGVAGFVLVSLVTPPEASAQVASFFLRLETPSQFEVNQSESGDQVRGRQRDAAESGQQLLLVNLFHPLCGAAGAGFWRAYRVDLSGFAKGWLVALSLVVLAWLVFRG